MQAKQTEQTKNRQEWENAKMQRLTEECKKYNYSAILRFGTVFVYTRFETWKFDLNENGVVKLMHGSRPGKDPGCYHKQFTRKIGYRDLVLYIHDHEEAKYSGRLVRFSMTKDGAKLRTATA